MSTPNPSPWPAALVSAGTAGVLAIVLSLGIAALSASHPAAGDPGVSGAAGRDGADGRDGAPGLDGTDGRDGADGRDGVRGLDGRDGLAGAPGLDGAPGVDGAPGLDGATGASGAPGATGAPGAAGAAGTDGVDGLDAVVTYSEAATVNGVLTTAGGMFRSVATLTIPAVDPGRYVLVFNVPRISHDLSIPNQPMTVDCFITGPASTVSGLSNFVHLPYTGLRSYSNGAGTNTRGTIWNTSAVVAINVNARSDFGVECASWHTDGTLPDTDPSVTLENPSAIVLRAG